jgi:hypothetical protein
MNKKNMILVRTVDQLPEKMLLESAFAKEEIDYEIENPRFIANSLYQEHGPWDFLVPKIKQYEAEQLIGQILGDKSFEAPVAPANANNIQKAWAWFVIFIVTCTVAIIVFMFSKL